MAEKNQSQSQSVLRGHGGKWLQHLNIGEYSPIYAMDKDKNYIIWGQSKRRRTSLLTYVSIHIKFDSLYNLLGFMNYLQLFSVYEHFPSFLVISLSVVSVELLSPYKGGDKAWHIATRGSQIRE